MPLRNEAVANTESPVIIATDGCDQSDGAMRLGRLLASGASALKVVTVVKPLPIVSPEMALPLSSEIETTRRAEQGRLVDEQAARVWGENDVDVELCEGDAALMVADRASRAKAAMIVAGMGRHRVMDRVFGDETALRLIRLADVPVLAVTQTMTQLPSCILVALDFSETSLRAARLALEIAAPTATVYLAHVATRDTAHAESGDRGTLPDDDAGTMLYSFREHLRPPSGMVVQCVRLQGDPATELLAFAASVNADLIATGSHGHGFVTRMLVGSVTTRILRASSYSVLCVPPAAVIAKPRPTTQPPVTKFARPEWSTTLDAFSRRNVGRRGTLEVDDPELGAQSQEHDYPMLGATYDPHDGRVELMLGELGDVSRHLTRSIVGVDGIDVLRNERGQDVALRISHGRGQTLLTFDRLPGVSDGRR